MAHFAKVNVSNIVEQVIVVDNEFAPDEKTGKEFIASIGLDGEWIQASYNASFRGKYPGAGWIYDPVADEFKEPVTEIQG